MAPLSLIAGKKTPMPPRFGSIVTKPLPSVLIAPTFQVRGPGVGGVNKAPKKGNVILEPLPLIEHDDNVKKSLLSATSARRCRQR